MIWGPAETKVSGEESDPFVPRTALVAGEQSLWMDFRCPFTADTSTTSRTLQQEGALLRGGEKGRKETEAEGRK